MQSGYIRGDLVPFFRKRGFFKYFTTSDLDNMRYFSTYFPKTSYVKNFGSSNGDDSPESSTFFRKHAFVKNPSKAKVTTNIVMYLEINLPSPVNADMQKWSKLLCLGSILKK